jgi:putative transposase
MPWMETNPMEQRKQMVRDRMSGLYTLQDLSDRYGVSTKTVKKILGRALKEGEEGLKDRSRAPHTCPHQTGEEMVERILELKARYPRWGAAKLRQRLRKTHPDLVVPAASTFGSILKKHGLTESRPRRHRPLHPGAPVRRAEAPNELWTADFKGQFKTLDGVYCYPLTVADLHSRYLLGIDARLSTGVRGAIEVFTRLFRENGLPTAIRTDNGQPFCSTNAIAGLSQLNVFWMSLGIHHERTEPASPEQNGAHERMHRTLKRDTTRPPMENLAEQQKVFDFFREEYNQERPHDALDGDIPGERYTPSPRPFPEKLPAPEYPSHMLVRKVSSAGTVRLEMLQPFLSSALAGRYVGYEEVDDGIWGVHFYGHFIAHYNANERCYLH